MEGKRNLNFEISNANELNKMLTGVLMQVRRGELDHDTVKSITLVADKINKNNVNQFWKSYQKDINNFQKQLLNS